MSDKRLMVTKGFRLPSEGGVRTWIGGRLYNVTGDARKEMLESRHAYEEGHPPTCDICGSSFEGAGAFVLLEKHMDMVHRVECKECLEILEGVNKAMVLVGHIADKHTDNCPECGAEFAGMGRQRRMERHINSRHPASDDAEEVRADEPDEPDNPDDPWDGVDATDAAKALAREHGIAPEDVDGTGDGGRVTKPDVDALITTEE